MSAGPLPGNERRRRLLMLGASFALVSCGGGSGGSSAPTPPQAPTPTPPSPAPTPTPTPSPAPAPAPAPAPSPTPVAKSAKRGVAYDLATSADLQALSAGVSWWYDWGARPNAALPANAAAQAGMDFVPMLWNASYDATSVENFIKANNIRYLLVLNEPNLVDQADMTPAQAAAAWPGYEAVAAATGAKIVGPAVTWGTMPGYSDPVVWLDAFIAAYQAANGGRSPRIDYLAFHWYDYGLAGQLDRL
ncbi:MAG: glycosyl hydrolase, partial [Burkholderiaceae bacterium]